MGANLEWMDYAACRGMGHVMFSRDDEGSRERDRRQLKAAELCGSCPVRQACREWVLGQAVDPVQGSYCAGMTERERNEARWTRTWNPQAPFAAQLTLMDELIHGSPIPGLDKLLTGNS